VDFLDEIGEACLVENGRGIDVISSQKKNRAQRPCRRERTAKIPFNLLLLTRTSPVFIDYGQNPDAARIPTSLTAVIGIFRPAF
jgi:hypothetical protein